jgi:hypothetical protein
MVLDQAREGPAQDWSPAQHGLEERHSHKKEEEKVLTPEQITAQLHKMYVDAQDRMKAAEESAPADAAKTLQENQAWANEVERKVSQATLEHKTHMENHSVLVDKLKKAAKSLYAESAKIHIAQYQAAMKKGRALGESQAEMAQAAIDAGEGKISFQGSFTVMKPQNLVVPHPKKKVEDMGNYRIHHVQDVLEDVELLQEDTNAPVQLKFGEGAMDTYDEPLAVKGEYKKRMSEVADMSTDAVQALAKVENQIDAASKVPAAQATEADAGLKKLLEATEAQEAKAAETKNALAKLNPVPKGAKVTLLKEDGSAVKTPAMKNDKLSNLLSSVTASCPTNCGSCSKTETPAGNLACKSCKSKDRTLIAGECKLCNVPFCTSCEGKAIVPPPKDPKAAKEALVCKVCGQGRMLVGGQCEACSFDGCDTCGVRKAMKSEQQKANALGVIPTEVLTCSKCKAGLLLVNGQCRPCKAPCKTCKVQTKKAKNGRRLLAGEALPQELVCASCPSPSSFPDGGKKSPIHLAGGTCKACDFKNCDKCVVDKAGENLHCSKCVAPFLPIGSDDPDFAKTGFKYDMVAQCQKCASNCLSCAIRPHWCTSCDTTIGLALAIRGESARFKTTAATCLPVHPTCKTSNVPKETQASIPGPLNTALTAAYSCTSCFSGYGISTLLNLGGKTGKCVKCHSSCKDCHRGGDPNSCTSCAKTSDALTTRDGPNAAGSCGTKACDGCVTRKATCAAGSAFEPVQLAAKAEDDQGVCRKYTGDCSATCVPGDDAKSAPGRRVCSKHCHQKTVKTLAKGGKKQIVVCALRKVADCTKATGGRRLLQNANGAVVPSESCKTTQSAQCVASIPFTESANSMSPCGVVAEQAVAVANGAKLVGASATMGCANIPNEVCESSLIMF